MAALLEVKDLKTYFYTKAGVVKAVDGVSYGVSQGEALGVVGESGCGKSVSALSIMRLVKQPPGRIVDGAILFKGQNLLDLEDKEMRHLRGCKIAMIFQDPIMSLNPVHTIGRQIGEVLRLHMGMNKAQARNRTVEMLELVGIPSAAERLGNYPYQFSGGMCQRVMIAMALACNPEVIIADEPTTALDVTIQAQIIELFKKLIKELKTTVIWISHDLGVVAGLCDKVNVMYAGRVVETAPVRELFAKALHPYTTNLLKCIPRLDAQGNAKLMPIDGLPPNLGKLPAGCAFHPRCPQQGDLCQKERPTLRSVRPGHDVACWKCTEGAA